MAPRHHRLFLRSQMHVSPIGALSTPIVAVTVLLFAGCTSEVAQHSSDPEIVTIEDQGDEVSSDNVMTLIHDFGLVRPNSLLKTSFTIRNDTDKLWRIERITNNCACTTAGVSTFDIPPSFSSDVELLYRAGSTSRDDNRRLTVELSGETAPVVVLNIKANVRAPLTVLPKELDAGRIGFGQGHKESYFIVQNFTKASWNGIKVESKTPWLHCAIDRQFGISREPPLPVLTDPRQQWRVRVTACSDDLAPGIHQGIAIVTSEDSTNEKFNEIIPIRMTIIKPVACVPGKVFFSKDSTKESIRSVNVSLYLADNVATNAVSSRVSLTQHPENVLHLDWEKRSGRLWVLKATLDTGNVRETLAGQIIVSFENEKIEPVKIPYRYVN